MSFMDDVEAGWSCLPRGDQINVWGAEVQHCAHALDHVEMPDNVKSLLHRLFFEVGRLCRDADYEPRRDRQRDP